MSAKHIFLSVVGTWAAAATMAVGQTSPVGLTSEEKALVAWAEGFQARAAALQERVTAPSRESTAQQITENVDKVAAQNQEMLQTNMDALKEISKHGAQGCWHGGCRVVVPRPGCRVAPYAPIVPFVWGPSPAAEVTRRQVNLLKAWDNCREDHTLQKATDTALARDHAMEKAVAERQAAVVKDQARLANIERTTRQVALRKLARPYAINWLLTGHPEAYLPASWNGVIHKTTLGTVLRAGLPNTKKLSKEEIQSMDDTVKNLTNLLVSVAMGDQSTTQLVDAERQLRTNRDQARTTLATLTGQEIQAETVKLASR